MIRFLFPGFVVITLFNAYVIDKILFDYKSKILKIIVFSYLLFLVLYSFPFKKTRDYDGVKIFLGLESREKYLEEKIDSYKIIKKINNDSAIDGKIVLIKEIREYYLNKDYIWGDPVNQGLISYKNINETLNTFKTNKIKYILLNNNQYNNADNDGYTQNIYEIIDDLTKKYSNKLYCENNSCIYEMKY